MSEVLKTTASLSLSGSLVILVLMVCKPLLKDRLSKRWQYYIWLAAVARLLLPLSPEISPVGELFRESEPAAPVSAFSVPTPVGTPETAVDTVQGTAGTPAASAPVPQKPISQNPVSQEPAASPKPVKSVEFNAVQVLFLVWLGGALFLLARRVTAYQSFLRCIRAGRQEVSDTLLLDRLAQTGSKAGVRRPVELWENPLAASPILLGVLRPRIVLPSADLPEADFRYTVLHELTHYKRGDLVYKWLVQLTVCLHWFNPLVWRMEREISRACELACDEAVLQVLNPEERRAYGGTLLRALESGGPRLSVPGSASLGESAKLLKERLNAIMNFKKQSPLTAVLSLFLTAALVTGAAAAGAYTGPVKRNQTPSTSSAIGDRAENSRLRAGQCYKEGNVAGFSIVLPFLSQEEQNAFAERAYQDGYVNFFSVLARGMNEDTLDGWIDRASRDSKNSFLAMLLDKAGRDGERDALEEQWDAQQRAEYASFGVTWEGKSCCYNGQLVRIFLDARVNRSFFTLDTNPQGKVDIKILRDENDQLQGVAYMTAAEVGELLGDWAGLEEPVEMDTLDFRGTTWYLVTSEAQLRAIGDRQYGLDLHYLQQADIQLSSEEWVPIGTAERPFTGDYNGNGFEIKGLTMKDPEAKLVGLFGVGSGADIYNVTLRDYDVAYAGRRVSQKAVGPVLAQGLNGSRCFDNFLYPKELNGGTVIHIPIDRKWVWDGEYCMLGEYTLSVGDRLQYDISAETGDGLEIGFADMEHRPDEVSYATVSNRRQDGTLSCTADLKFGGHLKLLGRFRLFLHATDGGLGNVKGSITLTLMEGDQDFPEIPPLTAYDIQALTTDGLPAAAQKLLNQCVGRTWYLIHSEGRQYVWYDGFPEQYLYIPAWEDGGWKITIRKRQQSGTGYVLLSFPDGIPLTIIADGNTAQFTEIGK